MSVIFTKKTDKTSDFTSSRGYPVGGVFFMAERVRDPKREQEDKIRCANYLLQMFEKYGAKILAKKQAEEAGKDAQIDVDRK